MRRQVTSDIEPPITHKNCLRKLGAIWTQETRLSSIDIAIMPSCIAWQKGKLLNYYSQTCKKWQNTYLDIWSPCRQKIRDILVRHSRNSCRERQREWDNRCLVVLRITKHFNNNNIKIGYNLCKILSKNRSTQNILVSQQDN